MKKRYKIPLIIFIIIFMLFVVEFVDMFLYYLFGYYDSRTLTLRFYDSELIPQGRLVLLEEGTPCFEEIFTEDCDLEELKKAIRTSNWVCPLDSYGSCEVTPKDFSGETYIYLIYRGKEFFKFVNITAEDSFFWINKTSLDLEITQTP
jgi:hypothetical protein